ncbi:MAG TPA: CHAT domain-containing tetratricopeptide repeat protein, partial [Blastocatellia bacterium]|nr:CHAT domain-containing tetratricopeptide repeat protein [Blastocatellia bacterium]
KADYAQSEALHQRALTALENSLGPAHPQACISRNNLAQISISNRKLPQAASLLIRNNDIREDNMATVLTLGSERDKLLYMATLSEETDLTVSFHTRSAPMDPQAARLALETVFRRKGRLIDAMADITGTLMRRAEPADRKLLEDLANVRSQLAALVLRGPGATSLTQHQANISRLEAEKDRLEAEASARSAPFRAQSQPVTFAHVQAAIPVGAALVEIVSYRPFNPRPATTSEVFGSPRYVAYVIRRRGTPRWVDLGEAAAIDRGVTALRAALRNIGQRNVKRQARAVDERVMRPIRRLLSNTRRVFISPDGALNLVPFAALVDERYRYLVQRYSFTYLTSGRDLLRLQVRRRSRRAAMIFANPGYEARAVVAAPAPDAPGETKHAQHTTSRTISLSEVEFSPLPGTMEEGQAIGRLIPEAELITEAKATEMEIKRVSAPDILHVATHGFFLGEEYQVAATAANTGRDFKIIQGNVEQPQPESTNPLLLSGIALAGANGLQGGGGEDGILTGLEAAGLDLWGTKLVVLSACETGVGEVKSGQGVYGLRRALVIAGAESQVMTLWSVDDIGTRDLMVGYYRRLRLGAGRTEALRQMQLKMISSRRYSHPYYWAGVIQSGDWRGL